MAITIRRVADAELDGAPDATSAVDGECRGPIIQRNGAEYLITVNGSVFLALSLAQANTIANRMRSRWCDRE